MSFRTASIKDIEPLLALENACYPPCQAYSRAEYRYALATARAVNVAWDDKGIIGFVGAFYHSAWRVGHVFTVNVHPKARGQGLGRRLMEECEKRLSALGMQRVVLEVNVENAAAIALYEACGYERLQRLENYYTQYENNDAFLYAKEL
ncbi:MAG: N-acetyltransferase [Candidatus Thermoplasmatota archaeon]